MSIRGRVRFILIISILGLLVIFGFLHIFFKNKQKCLLKQKKPNNP